MMDSELTEISAKFFNLMPKQSIVYYIGFIAIDKANDVGCTTEWKRQSAKTAKIARFFMDMEAERKCYLVQQKIRDFMYRYIAIKV